jgi:hypothetical protein
MAGELLAYFIVTWTFGVIALVVYKLLIGHINLNGLLSNSDDGSISPERVQLLLVTLASVALFAQEALFKGKLPELSDVSTPSNLPLVLAGFGGSQTLYVIGKYARQLLSGGTVKGEQ